uniref:Uncharacterized protein n=1 Tax=Rhizophora mucronata TaxID=61149 RepID=A0A2P2PHM4_RHIMU
MLPRFFAFHMQLLARR